MTSTEQGSAPGAPVGPDRAAPGPGLRRSAGALAGLLAAAVALGVAELLAGLIGPSSSPVIAVGDAAITLTPEAVKSFAIETFGENDKIALVVGTLAVIAVYAAVLGVLGLRRPLLGAAGVLLFGAIGVLAALTRPAGGLLDALPSAVGAGFGALALLVLLVPFAAGVDAADEEDRAPGMDRRGFVLRSGSALAVAAVTGTGGSLLQRRFEVADARESLTLPRPASPAPALPAGADLSTQVAGLTSLVTRNRDFYRVDTAISVPQVRPADFRLRLTGGFDRPRAWSLRELFDRNDLIERDITLTCVSNEVGGGLAGTARWLGVPLGDFLREHGVRQGSDQLVCRSTDGMTIGTPTRSALDVEDAMLAFGMNGEPLPVEHGFPLRMLVPGLYGYVSACKWLTEIEASTYDAFDPYWTARDWAVDGPIKIASRVDTPAPLRSFAAGRRPVAGVAWAQTRGIRAVEVQVDDADWAPAELSPEVDADLWRQWMLPVDFAPGSHRLTVRATGSDGEKQTDQRASPFPNGSSGLHSIQVTAR